MAKTDGGRRWWTAGWKPGGKRRDGERLRKKTNPAAADMKRLAESPASNVSNAELVLLSSNHNRPPHSTMAKRALQGNQMVKLIVGAGQASPSPPVGPALGSKGVKSIDFCKVRRATGHRRCCCHPERNRQRYIWLTQFHRSLTPARHT